MGVDTTQTALCNYLLSRRHGCVNSGKKTARPGIGRISMALRLAGPDFFRPLVIPRPVKSDLFNAQPKAPAFFVVVPRQAGASGWALNDGLISAPILTKIAVQF